jgi:hypothetical protein
MPMLKDKSRVLFLGALVLLIVALSNGGIHLHGFRFFHGFTWLSWLLFGLFIWLLLTRTGCCGGGDDGDELSDEDLDVDDGAKE